MIEDYGWSLALQDQFAALAARNTIPNLTPGRVIVQQRDMYRIMTRDGEASAHISGRFMFSAEHGGYPVTGDWVAAAMQPGQATAVIHHVLPRRSAFVRKAAGTSGQMQVVAANVETVLIVTSLNGDLNLRRLERTLAIAWESGAAPVIILTKADLCDDLDEKRAAVQAIAKDVRVVAVSAVNGSGLDALKALIPKGETAVLLGSSGVGKSTLVNALAGETKMATRTIRESDARGRHTTTHRELFLLPHGGCILDTPGMREMALWETDTGVEATFADIEALAENCRFRDCSHRNEPGCAVQAALASGELDEARWQSHQKLQKETSHEARKDNPLAKIEHKKHWAKLTRQHRGGKKNADLLPD